MAGSSQLAWIGGLNSQVFNGFTSYRPTQNRFALRRPSYDLQRLKIVPVPSLHFKIGRPFLEETGSLFSWHKIFPQQPCPYIHLTSVSCAARAVMPSKEIVVATLKGVPTLVASVLSVLHGHTRSTLLSLQSYPLALQLAPAIGIFLFASWGLSPCMYMVHRSILKGGRDWEKSQAKHIMTSYLRPLMLWMAVITVCRALDPILLSSERSQAIKERVINFVRSLSTVLAFAFCTHRLTQQLQNFMMERHNSEDARNLGFHFIGSAVSTSVWVAAVCLFMELLGFSTQKWITAGGFGTVLVTLAGREIFTNFLSSVMIHATRPFVESEWIQTKIDGQEVSGTVEHVGWWSPTVIRGDDREAVHIPNHKFTVSIVRNLSQKTHWRIKTHIGISHYDVNKISLIVADMRKVLSKHPQVEHKRLHRRVFFDNIDPENQALMILVSCFVKTSHFEEYLRVKEIILLNLLKVISHHNARLATPIRSVQRVLDESETRQSPFRNARNAEGNRPFLLGEASTLIEPSEMVLKPESSSKASRAEAVDSELEASKSPSIVAEETGELKVKQKKTEGSTDSEKNPIADISQQKPQLEGLDSMGLNSKDISLLGAAFEKPPAKISEGPIGSGNHADIAKPSGKASEIVIENTDREIAELEKVSITNSQQRADGRLDRAVDNKVKPAEETPEDEKVRLKVNNNTAVIEDTTRKESKGSDDDDDPWRQQGPSPTQKQDNISRNSQFLEENLVLGVALDGPKRTLPLDDEVEQKERIILKNGNSSKERHEKPQQSTPAVIEER